MSTINKSIRSYLSGISAVTDEIGTSPMRFYPDRTPHRAAGPPTYPLCVHMVDAEPRRKLTAAISQDQATVTIEVYAATRDSSDTVADAIKTAIHGKANLDMGTHFVHDCTLIHRAETVEDNTDGSAHNANYITILDFLIDYE